MQNLLYSVIVGLSKYLIIILFACFLLLGFSMAKPGEGTVKKRYTRQKSIIYMIHFLAFLILVLKDFNKSYIIIYFLQLLYLVLSDILYRFVYKGISLPLLNVTNMLIAIGFFELTRLDVKSAYRQLLFISIISVICLLVPVIVEKAKILKSLTVFYAVIGLALLSTVIFFGVEIYGAKNWINIHGIMLQPSEFVKIIFVFFMASALQRMKSIKHLFFISLVACVYVLVLVYEKDLGGALIFFVTYLFLVYVSTKNMIYLICGVVFGTGASVIAYQLFDHVRIRVKAYLDPWSCIDNEGYQVAQSLFAIGTGKWLGMGFTEGDPKTIPVVTSDFIFSAICEEFGSIFGICLIMLEICAFIIFINIAIKIKGKFYKYLAIGLAVEYTTQVFLTIAGAVKFVPSTGVTLPLISYGGSSIISTIILIEIVQGIYALKNSESEELLEEDSTGEINVPELYDYNEALAEEKAAVPKRVFKASSKKNTNKKLKKKEKSQRNNQVMDEAEKEPLSRKQKKDVLRKQKEFLRKQKAKRRTNRCILKVSYIFVFLFLLMSASIVKFLLFEADTRINNPYNKRQDILENKVLRGDIVSSDGEVLATTKVFDDNKTKRVYPFGSTFCHAIGRTDVSRTGLELSNGFDLLESHTNPLQKLVNDFEGKRSDGDTLYTTLNAELQKVADSALGSQRGAVVAMDPKTGKILALVSKPDYDPNEVLSNWKELNEKDSEESALLNRATNGLYTPGSTFKILTALEYIKENRRNKAYQNYSYECNGTASFSGYAMKCYGNEVHGSVNLEQSMAHSCNNSFASIGLTLNLSRFKELCDGFEFNKVFEYNPAISKSEFKLDETANVDDIIQTSIGQGETLVSPMHNLMIVSAIANGGEMVEPQIVDHMESINGRVISKYKVKSEGSKCSKRDAKIINNYLKAVVDYGTATALNSLPFEVAGKTGSAEVDADGTTHAWFVGYAPADDPEIAVAIVVEGVGTGSVYAVPIAKSMFETYLG